jgi:hypothetical protein
VQKKKKGQGLKIVFMKFTITVKQLNNVVVKKSQVVSLGGN